MEQEWSRSTDSSGQRVEDCPVVGHGRHLQRRGSVAYRATLHCRSERREWVFLEPLMLRFVLALQVERQPEILFIKKG